MKLLFLGTGAADWSLALIKAYGWGRRFSSALVDDTLLIDPGPHIWDFAEENGKEGLYRNVTDIIVTHSHGDHFNTDTVRRIVREAGHPVRLWASPPLFTAFDGNDADLPEMHPLTLRKQECCGGYNVTPCRSNHGLLMEGEDTFNFIVEKDGRSFFYGADSGWIMYETWQLIKKARPNAVIFEATTGTVYGDDRVFGHTSIPMIGIMVQTMRQQRGIADDCRFYTTHMARTLHGNHAQTCAELAPMGVTPAYDGLEINI